MGPPDRNIAGWQKVSVKVRLYYKFKVWRDYKYNAKRKLRTNINSQKRTGGGPAEKCYISPLEEATIAAAGLEVEVSGLRNTKTFGAPSSLVDNSIERILSEWECDNPSQESTADEELSTAENIINVEDGSTLSIKKENENNNSTLKSRTTEQIYLIKEELEANKSFHNNLLKAVSERNATEKERLDLEKEKFIFEREKQRDKLQYRTRILELKIKKIECMQHGLD